VTILSRLDIWLGKTLFHPPIILACQLTRQTQHAMHKALWFFAACHATYFLPYDSWFIVALVWGYTILLMIGATAFADVPSRSWGGFRLVIWIFVILGLITTAITGEVREAQFREIIILFAEYAATIKTIPPRRKRERRTSAKEARI
jgi:hypothetical protein